MRDAFIRTLLNIAKKDKNVHLLTGDLGFGVLKDFFKELPNQITNVGIAEQNMTGFATGMALEGKIVFTYSIGNFPTLRTLEQIRNDVAYHNANVKIVSIGGGFSYGPLGMSHHATEDLSVMRSLPNIKVFAPSNDIETEQVTKAIYKSSGPAYLRLGRESSFDVLKELNFQIGKANKVINGKNIAIFSIGQISEEAYESIKILNKKGVFPSLFTFPTLKPFDKDLLKNVSKNYSILVTIEEHNIIGGLASTVSECLTDIDDSKIKLIKFAIPDKYAKVVGTQKFLRKKFGLDSKYIANKILDKLSKT
jgi:transketolase